MQVWDLQQGVMLYQSAILTASPLTAVAVDPTFPRVAVGASDGTVRFFDLSSLPACRALQVSRGRIGTSGKVRRYIPYVLVGGSYLSFV